MTKKLQQARGSNVRLAFGLESVFGTAAADNVGKTLKFNSSALSATRDLNSSETIQPGRSPVEPFQGNGSVDGDVTVPLDLNQLAYIFRLMFGAPVTTQISGGSSVEKAITGITYGPTGYTNKVSIEVGDPEAFAAGDIVEVTGTTDYNGTHRVLHVEPLGGVVLDVAYATNNFTSGAKLTKVIAGTYSHVFTIKEDQPSFTIEQLHKDLAESFVFQGCKFSTMTIGAASDGQENTVTVGVMGSKPKAVSAPMAISAIGGSGSTVTLTVPSGHGIVVGDSIVVAGSVNYNGVHAVTAKTDTSVSFAQTYVAETVTANQEPVLCKAHFVNPGSYPLARLGTFSARLYKDGAIYDCAKTFSITFDFGLDGDQRCIGDDGYRSSIPEGTVTITSTLTALFKSGELFRDGAENTTVGLKLQFTDPDGVRKLVIELPENKVQPTSPPVDSARGLSQDITVQSFSSTSEEGDSACTITVVNNVSAYA